MPALFRFLFILFVFPLIPLFNGGFVLFLQMTRYGFDVWHHVGTKGVTLPLYFIENLNF
jgi:hypothetical protein